MLLEQINNMLNDEELGQRFYGLTDLIKDLICNNNITEFKISKNVYPANHFIDIYTLRLNRLKKKKKVLLGLEETIEILKKTDGSVSMGYIESAEKHFVLFFSESLSKLIALFQVVKKSDIPDFGEK